MKKSSRWLVGIGALFVLSFVASAASTPKPTEDDPIKNYSSAQEVKTVDEEPEPVEKEPEITTKIETKTVAIPHETQTVNSSSLAKGTTKVQTAGVDGSKTVYYEVTYTDGVETSRVYMREEVTVQPVTEVILNGTYVKSSSSSSSTSSGSSTQSCANGTYVNSAGVRVCRPSSTNTGGATARCKDGTYSYSQSRRGTCSHHGGVARWL